jgi:transposase
MDYHHHARLTVYGREQMCRSVVEGGLSLCEAAVSHKLSRQTAAKWVRRYREGGVSALADRSSRPHRMRQPTCSEQITRVENLRRERWTGVRIAQATGLSRATVCRILQRLQLNKARHLEPQIPVIRYEHPAPGDRLHLDIKKFARIVKAGHRITGNPQDETHGAGWEFLYVAVDDHSRIAYTALFPTRQLTPLPASWPKPWPGFSGSASRCGACSPTTAPASMLIASPMPAARSPSPTSELESTPRAPTEKPNASSKPPSGNGPMPDAMRTPRNDHSA